VLAPAERRFSTRYKRRILAEVDACQKFGQIEALLSREGLYCAHLFRWRQQLTKRGGRA
jgi:transposase-like protein